MDQARLEINYDKGVGVGQVEYILTEVVAS